MSNSFFDIGGLGATGAAIDRFPSSIVILEALYIAASLAEFSGVSEANSISPWDSSMLFSSLCTLPAKPDTGVESLLSPMGLLLADWDPA